MARCSRMVWLLATCLTVYKNGVFTKFGSEQNVGRFGIWHNAVAHVVQPVSQDALRSAIKWCEAWGSCTEPVQHPCPGDCINMPWDHVPNSAKQKPPVFGQH